MSALDSLMQRIFSAAGLSISINRFLSMMTTPVFRLSRICFARGGPPSRVVRCFFLSSLRSSSVEHRSDSVDCAPAVGRSRPELRLECCGRRDELPESGSSTRRPGSLRRRSKPGLDVRPAETAARSVTRLVRRLCSTKFLLGRAR